MNERSELRCRTEDFAGIVIDWQALSSTPVKIEDFSGGGCRLRLTRPVQIPGSFDLALSGYRDVFACSVTWSRGDEIGVRFGFESQPANERRSERRVPVNMTARLSNRDKTLLRVAKICNATRTGCMVEANGIGMLEDEIFVCPEKFVEPIPASFVWRRGNQAGIEFAWRLNHQAQASTQKPNVVERAGEFVAL